MMAALQNVYNSPCPQNLPKFTAPNLDRQMRCLHYHRPTDIIAFKMKCCGLYYAYKDGHIALAGHPLQVWPQSEWHQPGTLLGACRTELTIFPYLQRNRAPEKWARSEMGRMTPHHGSFRKSEKKRT